MKFRITGILFAIGALIPTLALAQNPWDAAGVQQANYFAPSAPTGDPSIYEQLLPDRSFRDYEAACDLSFRETLARTYVRFNYLNWRISGGDGTLLGAPNSSGADLSGATSTNRLSAVDPVTGPISNTYAVVPSLNQNYDNIDGLQGTIGIPTTVGTLEVGAFYFAEVKHQITINPTALTQSPTGTGTVIGGMTLLNNGVVSNSTMIIFDQGYYAKQSTGLFGSEANWVFQPFTPNVPVTFSPLIGFRYLQLEDRLGVYGQNAQSSTVTLNHVVESLARNNIFGPQIGLRASTNVWRFELGAETKFMAGINNLLESVHTQEIYNPTTSTDPNATTEAPVTTKGHRTRFAPIFNISLNSKFHMTEQFSLFASYELMIGGGFSRAFDNIYYNAPASVNSAPGITLDPHLSKFMAHGFAIGGEYCFR
jgi:hypothetical protein